MLRIQTHIELVGLFGSKRPENLVVWGGLCGTHSNSTLVKTNSRCLGDGTSVWGAQWYLARFMWSFPARVPKNMTISTSALQTVGGTCLTPFKGMLYAFSHINVLCAFRFLARNCWCLSMCDVGGEMFDCTDIWIKSLQLTSLYPSVSKNV